MTRVSAGVLLPEKLDGFARMRAPAKINLALSIGPLRDDGFHEIATIFQAISLFDEVEVKFRPSAVGRSMFEPQIQMSLEGPDLGPVEENLAWRAAFAFMDRTGQVGKVDIRLVKVIPAGAGLGGGSSDAAAVIRCLARLTDFTDENVLREIASGIGSDVAFFLGGSPTAIGTGRGNRIESVQPLPERSIVLALPPVHVSTRDAYGALSESRDETQSLALPTIGTDLTWEGLLDGGGVNDFQATVAAMHESVAASLSRLAEAGARITMLSGSGSAAFAVFDDSFGLPEIDVLCSELTVLLGWPVLSSVTLDHMPEVEVL